MRVVSGHLGGRRLDAPPGTGTRPTSDRVREGLFSRLAALPDTVLVGARVLDLFAGSGALGIEALSRGAEHATFVERDPRALASIRVNVESLGLGDVSTILRGDAIRLAGRGTLPGTPFSLLFLDPPYRINKSEVRGAIEALVRHGLLTGDAIVAWEYATGAPPEWPEAFGSLGARTYGDTAVDIARRRGE